MPLIPFPNVPRLPGVPQLNRSPLFPPGPPPAVGGIIAIGRLLQALLSKPRWGIFAADPPQTTEDDGVPTVTVRSSSSPVVEADSIREFAFKRAWDVSNAPVETDSFASYNKVSQPFEIQLRLTKSGTLRDRTTFLQQLEDIAGTTSLYKIVTPEKVYPSVNVTRYEVARREAQGAYFLTEVDVFFIEIRFVTAEYSNTAANTTNATDPAARPTENLGDVNATEVPGA